MREKAKKKESLEPVVAILDAGGQYVDLVKKASERLGYPADMLPLKTPFDEVEAKYKSVIISGSPVSSHQEKAQKPDEKLWESSLPILGICYGMQAMAIQNGGKVKKNAIREDGRVTTKVDTSHPIFKGLKQDFTALFTHGDFVSEVPDGFKIIGQHKLSDNSLSLSAIAKGNKVGVQFHPEVFDDTPEGYELFKNFFSFISSLKPDEKFVKQRLKNLIKDKKSYIKKKAKGRKVIAFMSGGVDSSVAGTLAAKTVDLDAYYIDSGYMREEDEDVIDFLKKHVGMDVNKVDAEKDFTTATAKIDGKEYGPLEKEPDPQAKRRIAGKAFIDVQNKILKQLSLDPNDAALLQGTNAADRIESGYSMGDKNTQTIKTHHNLVPEARALDPIEPLDNLFKDEIRALGSELGLPDDLVWRQPFPGPGLAIRILLSDGKKPKHITDAKQKKVVDYLDNHPIKPNLKAQLLPVRSVGVGGDERSHLAAVAVQGNESWQNLSALASDIPAHFRDEINRVVLALSDNPIDKYTITKTDSSKKTREQLRKADKIVFEQMRKFNLLRPITQFPVVLIPVSFGKKGDRSIVLRPVITSTFMTVQAMLPVRDLPQQFLEKTTDRILSEVEGISQVFLDLTNKPPGTTEWE